MTEAKLSLIFLSNSSLATALSCRPPSTRIRRDDDGRGNLKRMPGQRNWVLVLCGSCGATKTTTAEQAKSHFRMKQKKALTLGETQESLGTRTMKEAGNALPVKDEPSLEATDADCTGEETQALGAAAPDRNQHGEDAESSSSSTAGTSGGSNRSSGGYSGDHSSVSDVSSDRRDRTKTRNHNRERSTERAALARDGEGDSGAAAAMHGKEAGATDADIGGRSSPPRDDAAGDGTSKDGAAGRQSREGKVKAKEELTGNIHETANSHSARLRANRDIHGKNISEESGMQVQNAASSQVVNSTVYACDFLALHATHHFVSVSFFQDALRPLLPREEQQPESSSGFTSFFTTTRSGSMGSSSEPSQNQRNSAPGQSASKDDSHGNVSDSSSMIVLARVRRKRQDQNRQTSSNTDSSNGSAKKSDHANGTSKRASSEIAAPDSASKECPQAKLPGVQASTQQEEDRRQQKQRAEGSSGMSSLSQSLDSSGSDSGSKEKQADCNAQVSSNTSSKAQSQPSLHAVSSSGTASGMTTANASSGSGTGSGNENNAMSKSESGSGDGNSNEQKVSGERDSTGGTDGHRGGSTAAFVSKAESNVQKHHLDDRHGQKDNRKASSQDTTSNQNQTANLDQEVVDVVSGAKVEARSKEKMIAKKRKRMNMRREYEAAVCQGSDSSTKTQEDITVLEPGQPVTLDQVLSFGKQARCVKRVHWLFGFVLLADCCSYNNRILINYKNTCPGCAALPGGSCKCCIHPSLRNPIIGGDWDADCIHHIIWQRKWPWERQPKQQRCTVVVVRRRQQLQ